MKNFGSFLPPVEAVRLSAEVTKTVFASNQNMPECRRVTPGAANTVVERSLVASAGLPDSLRHHLALVALSNYVALAQHDRSRTEFAIDTDLLPVAHPRSTRPHAMTASALRESRARWIVSDPRIDEDHRPLVAAALASEPGSVEHFYAVSRLEAAQDGIALRALLASFTGGNSSAARSARAKLQRRDRKGRFAYQGGGMSLNVRFPDGSVQSFTGRYVRDSDSGDFFEIETPDGNLWQVPASKAEGRKGYLPKKGGDGYAGVPANISSEDADTIVEQSELVRLDSPSGYRLDTDEDGTQNFVTNEEDYRVSVSQNEDGSKSFTVSRMDDDNTEVGQFKNWAEAHRALVNDGKQANKSDAVKARLGGSKGRDAEYNDFMGGLEAEATNEGDYRIAARSALDYFETGETGDETPDELASRLEKNASFAEEDGDADLAQDLRDAAEEVRFRASRGSDSDAQDSAPEFEAPEGMHALKRADISDFTPRGRTNQDSPDYTDDPAELAQRFDADTLREGLADALNGNGQGVMPFEQDERVPAAALYKALQEKNIDADLETARIYDAAAGNDNNERALADARTTGDTPAAELPEKINLRNIGIGDQVRTENGEFRVVKDIERIYDEENGYGPESRGRHRITFEDGSMQDFPHANRDGVEVIQTPKNAARPRIPLPDAPVPAPQQREESARLDAPDDTPTEQPQTPEPSVPEGDPEMLTVRDIGEGDHVKGEDGTWRKIESINRVLDEQNGYGPNSRGRSEVTYEDGSVQSFPHSERDREYEVVRSPENAERVQRARLRDEENERAVEERRQRRIAEEEDARRQEEETQRDSTPVLEEPTTPEPEPEAPEARGPKPFETSKPPKPLGTPGFTQTYSPSKSTAEMSDEELDAAIEKMENPDNAPIIIDGGGRLRNYYARLKQLRAERKMRDGGISTEDRIAAHDLMEKISGIDASLDPLPFQRKPNGEERRALNDERAALVAELEALVGEGYVNKTSKWGGFGAPSNAPGRKTPPTNKPSPPRKPRPSTSPSAPPPAPDGPDGRTPGGGASPTDEPNGRNRQGQRNAVINLKEATNQQLKDALDDPNVDPAWRNALENEQKIRAAGLDEIDSDVARTLSADVHEIERDYMSLPEGDEFRVNFEDAAENAQTRLDDYLFNGGTFPGEEANKVDRPEESEAPETPQESSATRVVTPARDLQPGDIAVTDRNGYREYFVIDEVSEGENGKMVVKGHFPGHAQQEKLWNADTTINVIRGAEAPPAGDGPELHKPFASDFAEKDENGKNKRGQLKRDENGNWYLTDPERQAAYEKAQKEYAEAVAAASAGFDDPTRTPDEDPILGPARRPGESRNRRPMNPGAAPLQGRLAEIAREADGDPQKFRELLAQESVYVFDFETTGIETDADGNKNGGQPWAISVAKIDPLTGEIIEQKTIYMNPGVSIADKYAGGSTNGKPNALDPDGNPLSDDWLGQQKSQEEALKEALEFMGPDAILIAHNVEFDDEVFRRKADDLDLDYAPAGLGDTMNLARWLHRDEEGARANLKALSDRYGVDMGTWHNADSDTQSAAAIFNALINDFSERGEPLDLDAIQAWHDSRVEAYENEMGNRKADIAEEKAQEIVQLAFFGDETAEVPDLDAVIAEVAQEAKAEDVDPDAGLPTEYNPYNGRNERESVVEGLIMTTELREDFADREDTPEDLTDTIDDTLDSLNSAMERMNNGDLESDPRGMARDLDSLAGDLEEIAQEAKEREMDPRTLDMLSDRLRELAQNLRRSGRGRRRRSAETSDPEAPATQPSTVTPEGATIEVVNTENGEGRSVTLPGGDRVTVTPNDRGGWQTEYVPADNPEITLVQDWNTDSAREAALAATEQSKAVNATTPSDFPEEARVDLGPADGEGTSLGVVVPKRAGDRAVLITNGGDLPGIPMGDDREAVSPTGRRLLRRGRENRNFWDHPNSSLDHRVFNRPLEGQFADRRRVPIAYGDVVEYYRPGRDGRVLRGVVLRREDNVIRDNGPNRDHVWVRWENGRESHYVSNNLIVQNDDTDWRFLVNPDEDENTPDSERRNLPAGFDWDDVRRGAAPSGQPGAGGELRGEGRNQNNIPVREGDALARFERNQLEGHIATRDGKIIYLGDRVKHIGKVGRRRGLDSGTVIGKEYVPRYRTVDGERVLVGYGYYPIVRWDNDPEIKAWSAKELELTDPGTRDRSVDAATEESVMPTLRRARRGEESDGTGWVPDTEAAPEVEEATDAAEEAAPADDLDIPYDSNGNPLDLGQRVRSSRNGNEGIVVGFEAADSGYVVRFQEPAENLPRGARNPNPIRRALASNLEVIGQPTRTSPIDPTGREGEPYVGEYGEWGQRAAAIKAAESRGPSREDFIDAVRLGTLDQLPARAVEMFGEVFGLTHTYRDRFGNQRSLRAEVDKVYTGVGTTSSPSWSRNGIQVSGVIYDENGNRAGTFQRIFFIDPNGELSVSHEYLVLNDAYQGTGFAAPFNRNAEDFYISRGIQNVYVHAALTGGGYAWAKQGFDFTDARRVVSRLRTADLNKAPTALLNAIQDIMRRFDRYNPGDPEYPTPQEVASIGWLPGASTWFGKEIMRGNDWYGVKRLDPSGRRISPGEAALEKWWHRLFFGRKN